MQAINRVIVSLALAMTVAAVAGCFHRKPVTFEVIYEDTGEPAASALVNVNHMMKLVITPGPKYGITDEFGVVTIPVAEYLPTYINIHAPRGRGRIDTANLLSEDRSPYRDAPSMRSLGPLHYRLAVEKRADIGPLFGLPAGFSGLVAIRLGASDNRPSADGVYQVPADGVVTVNETDFKAYLDSMVFIRGGLDVLMWSEWTARDVKGPLDGAWPLNAALYFANHRKQLHSNYGCIRLITPLCSGECYKLVFIGSLSDAQRAANRVYRKWVPPQDRPAPHDSEFWYELDCDALEQVLSKQAGRPNE